MRLRLNLTASLKHLDGNLLVGAVPGGQGAACGP